MRKVSQVLKSKNVALMAIHLITDFLVDVKMPISATNVEKSKNIEKRMDEVYKVRHIFQQWTIDNDPSTEDVKMIAQVYHRLSVTVENRLANLNSSTQTIPLLRGTNVQKNYKNYMLTTIKHLTVAELKNLCRLRYLKVSGKKNVLVERLIHEKW